MGLASALALVLPGAATAQDSASPSCVLRGRVEVRREQPPPEPRPAVADLGMAVRRDVPDRRRSVVYLETGPHGAFEETETAHVVLDQKNQAFSPYVLAVTVGTTVNFVNSDDTYHNVFSFSKPKRFDLGRYAKGQSRPVRFDRPGVVRVFCDIHSHMSSFILVFAHRYFATTDAEGRYRIAGIPPGPYTVVAWNDGQPRESRQFTLSPGAALDLDFTLR